MYMLLSLLCQKAPAVSCLKDRAEITLINGMTGFEWTMIPWKHLWYQQAITVVLGYAFFILTIVALLWPVRPIRRFRHHSVRAPGSVQTGEEAPVEKEHHQRSQALPVYINNAFSTSIDG